MILRAIARRRTCPVWHSQNSRRHASSTVGDLSRTRNLGIIAHIDAGKTTTTERMLYYSGYTPRIGDVDDGNTIMDYLPAERERGITIQSAAITLHWRDHRLNLIDTPGHADFTFEVERSLRVLDGAVAILDAVAGVEAQTEKVWRQAGSRSIPRLVFVNKMDRVGAGFGRTVREVATKLGARPLILQLPVFANGIEGGDFVGVVDLLTMRSLTWVAGTDGRDVTVSSALEVRDDRLRAEVIRAREALVDALSEVDDAVVEAFLECDSAIDLPADILRAAVRRQCLAGTLVPALLGASFRNIGVQPLLDAVVDYLPSPLDSPAALVLHDGKSRALTDRDPTCCLAFKVIIDAQRGPMTFVRVYSGRIQRGATLLNTTTRAKERVMRVLQIYADDATEVDDVSEGNIAVLLGLKDTRTGDTLVLAKSAKDHFSLQPIAVPPPVFIATLEAHSASELKSLEAALDSLQREDPSLHVSYDEDTGQTLLSGMGELHLEIAGNRLVNELKARAEIGKLRIGYRESVSGASRVEERYERTIGNKAQSVCMSVDVAPVELHAESHDNAVSVALPPDGSPLFSREDAVAAVRSGVTAALSTGPSRGYPVHATHVAVAVEMYDADTTLGALAGAARHLVQRCLRQLADAVILEPVMDVRVTTDEADVGTVMNDLSGRRGGQILSLDEDVAAGDRGAAIDRLYVPPDATMTALGSSGAGAKTVIHARVPLRDMVGYSKALMSLTKGRGAFVMHVDAFDRMPADRVARIEQP